MEQGRKRSRRDEHAREKEQHSLRQNMDLVALCGTVATNLHGRHLAVTNPKGQTF